MGDRLRQQTPRLHEVIQQAIDGRMFDLFTAAPATVVSYDASTNQAVVRPVHKRKYVNTDGDETVVDMAEIRNVPIAHPRAGQAALTFPIAAGDIVLLIWSHRSLDTWKTFGGSITPDDPRTHDYSDAIAIPGVYPSSNPVVIDSSNLVLRYLLSKITLKKNGDMDIEGGVAKITLKNTGKITIGNGAVDLLGLLDELIDQILLLTVPTGTGPSGTPNNATAIAAIKTKLGLIKN